MIELTSPLTIQASDPLPDWDFKVVKAFDGPAITIRGDLKANGIGEFVSKIRLDCNWLSGGVVYDRLDNAIVEPCKVYRSKGTAISVQSCRQSKFEGLQATEAVAGSFAIVVKNAFDERGDSTNGCLFSFISAYACGTASSLCIGGSDVPGLGMCRNNHFGKVFLHTTWQRQMEMIPKESRGLFGPNVTMLLLSRCQDISFARLTITTPETFKAIVSSNIDRCTFAGRVLVYDASQYVAPKGDVSKLAVVVRRDK